MSYDIAYDGSSYKVLFSRYIFDIDLGLTTSHKTYFNAIISKAINKGNNDEK